MALIPFGLSAGDRVLVDTNPLIYVLEGHPLAGRFVDLLDAIQVGKLIGVLTPITVAEVLAGPLRVGDVALMERYRLTLGDQGPFQTLMLDAEMAVLAARLRIQHRLKLPDAFQLAAAVLSGCDALITHDRDFSGVSAIPIVGLDAG
ncbi:MAG: PIN domain-containing protein [Myxococcales bacterium]|nr:PIN domain-containing protein [Myxococcales bacterium]